MPKVPAACVTPAHGCAPRMLLFSSAPLTQLICFPSSTVDTGLPGKAGGRKGHAWKPLVHVTISVFPHTGPNHPQLPGSSQLLFIINLTDPSASFCLLMVGAGLASRGGPAAQLSEPSRGKRACCFCKQFSTTVI